MPEGYILLLLVLLPVLGAALVLLMAGRSRNAIARTAAALPGIALVILLSQFTSVMNGDTQILAIPWLPQLDFNWHFYLDPLSALFALLVLGIGLLVILYARYYLSERDDFAKFYCYLLLFMASMLGVVLSGHLVQLWFFWELTSISSFLLITYWSDRSDARKGARMALTITGFGGLCLLAGVLLLGDVVGSYQLEQVLSAAEQIRADDRYPIILVLILLGVFTKSAQFPFHSWLPEAMAAPTPVSAYLHSATLVKAGVFLLARLYPALSQTEWWFGIVSLIGLITLLVGAYHALFKHDLKGLLAYSTISHLGLITLLFGLDTQLAAIAAVFHIINHAVFKASLFMAAGIIDHECGTRDMRVINGLWKYMPHTATLAMVAAAAMAGVPLMNGFLSKEMLFSESLYQDTLGSLSWLIPLLVTIAGGLGVAYSLRFIHDVFFNGEPKELPRVPHEPPRYMRVPVEILVVLCLLVGIFPGAIMGDILLAIGQVLQPGQTLDLNLSVWHGFNLPLAMSILAVIGGTILYSQRKPVYAFQTQFVVRQPKEIFERIVQGAVIGATATLNRFDNGNFNRQVAWLFIAAIVALGVPLLNMTKVSGSIISTPSDAITLMAASLLMVATILTVFYSHHRLVAVVMLSIVGLIVCLSFAWFSAPDLALTQLAVEVTSVILFLLVLYFLPQRIHGFHISPKNLVRDIAVATLLGALVGTLCFAMVSQEASSISQFFIDNAKTGGGGTNVVNVILVDFRGFDTFGEITVLAIAGMGIVRMVSGIRMFAPAADIDGRRWAEDKNPVMLMQISQVFLPLALLFSAYIFMRGHNLPGGGFIAGLITAVALVQQYIAHGGAWIHQRTTLDFRWFLLMGLSIALLTGIGSMVLSYPFLTSWFEYLKWPLIGKFEVATAMLFDLGVYLTVIGATVAILGHLGGLTKPDAVFDARNLMTKTKRSARNK